MMNENSLANLKKIKPKKEGYGYRYALPQEKIDELFSHLAEGLSLKKASTQTGICYQTARRYFREGDAKRGIQPLVQRLTIFQTRITEKMNVLLEEHRMQRINFVRNLLQKASDKISMPQKFYNKEGVEIEVYDLLGKKVESYDIGNISLKDIERLMKLETFLAGGVKGPEVKEESMMTAEQLSGADA